MERSVGEFGIRRARPEDLPAAAELLEEMNRLQSRWRIFRPRRGIREEILAVYRAASLDPEAAHLVAEAEGTVVGMALAKVHRPSTFSDEASVEVSSFVVRRADQGRGIGRALAAEVARFARDRGVQRLDLRVFSGNDPAIAFWTRLGFRPRMIQMVADVADVAPDETSES
jgi:ribosomal protein S18 acetylase RimI-like enzyme